MGPLPKKKNFDKKKYFYSLKWIYAFGGRLGEGVDKILAFTPESLLVYTNREKPHMSPLTSDHSVRWRESYKLRIFKYSLCIKICLAAGIISSHCPWAKEVDRSAGEVNRCSWRGRQARGNHIWAAVGDEMPQRRVYRSSWKNEATEGRGSVRQKRETRCTQRRSQLAELPKYPQN